MLYNTDIYHTERGVSEALGFMIIFSMVIIGIGLVTLYGYPMLIQQQTSADEQIMEKNMIVLQNDVKMLTYKTVPYKETALRIGGGSLSSYNPLYESEAPDNTPIFEIYDDDSNYKPVQEYRPGDLRYESDSTQTDISLQNGAVAVKKRIETGSFMLAEPRWFYDDSTNTMVISLIALNNTAGIISRAGIGSVQMTIPPNSTTVQSVLVSDSTYVVYDPKKSVQDYSTAWQNYFSTTLGLSPYDCAGVFGYSDNATCYLLPSEGGQLNLVIKKYDVTIRSL